MPIDPPTTDDIRRLAGRHHLNLAEEELEPYRELLADSLAIYETIDTYEPSRRYRPAGSRPCDDPVDEGADPYNAWITRCRVTGAGSGPLDGSTVAVKDNIPVAGVPMTCASAVVDDYVPAVDAPAVTRLLEAGATVVGKTNMDDMAASGDGSHSAFGPVLNPHDSTRLAGGSSGGSAVAVATGEADVALGTDQGGSVRAPAAWCGVVGIKPTHGLVPYTGAIGLDPTVDHIGPLAADVETAARALSVMAGVDEGDHRQPSSVPETDYAAAIRGAPESLSIGVVSEGFDRPGATDAVNARIRSTLDRLADAGATVETVSIPEHADGRQILLASIAEGLVATVEGEGYGHAHDGWYDADWIESFAAARRDRGGQFPPGFKHLLLLGAYVGERAHSTYYAKAMNLRCQLADAYDDRLANYDLLAMPTTPMEAAEYEPDQDLLEFRGGTVSNLANTGPFNATGHPATSVPVPSSDLPVGLMLVGERFDDATVIDGASAVENLA